MPSLSQGFLLYAFSISFLYVSTILRLLSFIAEVSRPCTTRSVLSSCKRIYGLKESQLTFCGVHSSWTNTIPLTSSIPANPPLRPADWTSFRTMSWNFSLSRISLKPPGAAMEFAVASSFIAGSAGTMIAIGLA
jgi:hypothetical protein